MRAANSRTSSKSARRNGATHAAMNGVREDLHAVKADLGRLKTDAVGVVTAGADTALAEAKARVDAAIELAKKARDRAESGAEQVSALIAERPITSLLIAVGVGAVLGRLFLSRR